jgi:hypothetical protein
MTAPDGDTAVLLLNAVLNGQDYPPDGVPDTPANKALYAQIAADVDAMPGGVLPDVPSDWSQMPDTGGDGQ